MRRFIRTITARRHINFFVIQDGDERCYEVLRWPAEAKTPELVASFDYLPHDNRFSQSEAVASNDAARQQAITEARRLAEAEEQAAKAAALAERQAAAAERSDEEAERIAQGLSPKAQERQRIDRLV